MTASRVDRNAVQASFWQFHPDKPDPEVEAMPASLSIVLSDEDRVMISVRGKQGRRYETNDSVWLELTDAETIHLIARLATAVQSSLALHAAKEE